jgi:hypothetical protein
MSEGSLVNEYENNLRRIIISVLMDKFGKDYEKQFGVPDERLLKWEEKRIVEEKKYPGTLTETRILFYSDFYDLKTIVTKNWEIFEVFFDQVEKYRNSLSHGRSLLSFQESFLIGLLGELKNQFVLYRNKNEQTGDYFLRILKVSDNYGNIWTSENSGFSTIITKFTLRPGDLLEFSVDAVDPKGREIQCQLRIHGKIVDGLDYEIVPADVRQIFVVTVEADTQSEYKNSASVEFFYSVLPAQDR